ncbi:hypothetical protein [Rhizobium sp. GN54]|uniref:hypothetical protein n=1 Tax=Rhizobium sp. GN54 TaxID=2898150 RepID=UPI001E5E7A5D|nr:hypothetical protein [Rhizobium sp. GN54]MCD2180986.1 hypothetical protein [Rhizobium sp. GN54]
MDEFDEVDLRLFGAAEPACDGLAAAGLADGAETATLVLDLKAEPGGDPLDDMQAMLSQMTKELRERFQRFQSQRRTAEQMAAEADDEAGRKLGQADAKAAIEAVSLIVRTLEKIDSLQRTILSERRDAVELACEAADFDAVVAEFDRRVEEKANAYLERWKADYEESARRAADGGTVDGGGTGAAGPGGDGENGP